MKIFCSQCGAEVKEKDILGVGTFDQNIGKYAGTTFVTFECSSCHRKEYQLLSQNPFQKSRPNDVSEHPELTPEEVMISERQSNFEANDLIDFHCRLQEIETIKEFLTLCSIQRKVLVEDQGQIIKQPQDIYNLFLKYNDPEKKRLMIFLVDEDNRLLTWETIGEGTKQQVSFDPQVIFRLPILFKGEAAVILAQNINTAQNHPNKKDVLRTKRLVKAGEILGIEILDHVVIHKKGFFSFDELNLL